MNNEIKILKTVWAPYLGRVRANITSGNGGYTPVMTDEAVITDMWSAAKAAGWTVNEIIASPNNSVTDILAIWG